MSWNFDNSFARELERFRAPAEAAPFPAPALRQFNHALASELGLDLTGLSDSELAQILTGQVVPDGAEPVAMAYSGHQFGHFSPMLGDGRALLLGEVIGKDGARRDLHLKGSGTTPFSRPGTDGRCALRPALREYLMSEAMDALGVPTTRSLAVTTTGETVVRQQGAEPGAVLARIARSHVRVGTFQLAAAHFGVEDVQRLADYVIARHFPDLATAPNPYLALLDRVIAVQTELVAQWMLTGFVHGVMNTDNVSIAGETIDYGPCAFLDSYSASTVFSSIDTQGRYAFGNQPAICGWNLTRLAEALGGAILAHDADAEPELIALLKGISDRLDTAWLTGMRRKLGLREEHEGDLQLAQDLFAAIEGQNADFTQLFRELASALSGDETALRALVRDPGSLDGWLARWRERIGDDDGRDAATRAEAMNAVNPLIIPRNHKVEDALDAAVAGDMAPFESLFEAVTHPFADRPESQEFAAPPPAGSARHVTFCGT